MNAVATGSSLKGTQSEFIVIAGVVGILIVLFSPIPPALLDFLLITNFSFGLLILLLTFYMEKPLAFSTFPSVLLIATLFRLSLNVAATRLILTQAYAGQVIHAIGTHVVAGNYVVGLVVFAILIVVQFVVVTSGAQRVAEVAARFTLDAMPGKQMSIDADLNMGLITEADARTRRRDVEREANFYGAMDGASKFVKGDAIAGIIIILINIVGGLTIGMVQKGMGWAEALHTYTLLTVGDGIVTQIPALVIATGTGIIVTRAATDAQLTHEIIAQITRYPKSLGMVGVALIVALMLPGLPKLPVIMLLAVVGTAMVFAIRASRREVQNNVSAEAAEAADEEQDIYAALKIDPIEVEVGSGLKALAGTDDGMLSKRLKAFRRQHAIEMGLVLQPIRLHEDVRRVVDGYAFRFFGATVAEGQIRPEGLLAINPGSVKAQLQGEATRDPTFGLPALWITSEQGAFARESGYTVVDPVTVLLTHFTEIIRKQGHLLMTRQETERLVGLVRESQPSLVEELVPNVLSLSDIQKVLQSLLRERVPVRNIELILESLAEAAKQIKDPDLLTERVRERLSLAICQRCTSRDGAIHVLTLEPGVDRALRDAVRGGEGQTSAGLEPNWIDAFVRALSRHTESMLGRNLVPVLICAPPLRRVVRRMVEAGNHHLSVVSTAEISSAATVKSFATVAI